MKRFWLSLFAGAMLFSMTGTAQAYLVSVYDNLETDMYLSAGSTINGIFDLTSALPQNSGYAQPYSVVDARLTFSFRDNTDPLTQYTQDSDYWQESSVHTWYGHGADHIINHTNVSSNPEESASVSVDGGQGETVSTSYYDNQVLNRTAISGIGYTERWEEWEWIIWPIIGHYVAHSRYTHTGYQYDRYYTREVGYAGEVYSSFLLGTEGLQLLSNTGLLGFNLTGTSGDLFFTQARLDVNLVDNTPVSPVPEPSTMLLLGTGLIGLAGFGKRKLSKSKA